MLSESQADHWKQKPNGDKSKTKNVPQSINPELWDSKAHLAVGRTTYKPATVFNCKYIGSGKVAAYVGIVELNGNNPYTARNSMAAG